MAYGYSESSDKGCWESMERGFSFVFFVGRSRVMGGVWEMVNGGESMKVGGGGVKLGWMATKVGSL